MQYLMNTTRRRGEEEEVAKHSASAIVDGKGIRMEGNIVAL